MTVRPLPGPTALDRSRPVLSQRLVIVALLVVATFGMLLVRLGPVVVPVLSVTLLVLAAALVDELTSRIPNRIVLACLGATAAGVPFVSSVQSADVEAVATRVLIGVALGGAPVLFLIWVLDPSLIGGGDWKLLAVSSAALGLLLPIAAVIASMVACLFQFVRFALLRERSIPFGPAIAAGMLLALTTAPTISRLTGGELV